MNIEKKLIQLFRTFVEKALVPQIRKTQGSLTEWNRFSALLSSENINYSQLQLVVDTLPPIGNNIVDKPNIYKKKQQGQGSEFGSFNPSKTFGGERNKLNIFQITEDQTRDQQRDQSNRQRTTNNANPILLGLQKLMKNLIENQTVIENLAKQTTTNPPTNTQQLNSSMPNNIVNGVQNNNGISQKRESLNVHGNSYQVTPNNTYSYNSNNLPAQGFYKGHY